MRRIALVVYDGVLDDECEAFRSVLGLMRDAEVVSVGSYAGSVGGVGGPQHVDLAFFDTDHADVVIVPGGIGCERAARDPELQNFLRRMERSAQFIAASSTGTVVLASAGLLHGRAAATHWLAADLLRRYGSATDGRRMVVAGNVITCEGSMSAVDAAFALVERLEGSDEVDSIRATLLARGDVHLPPPSRLARLLARLRRPSTSTDPEPPAVEPSSDAPITPLSVMVELVDNDELAREMKHHARYRRKR